MEWQTSIIDLNTDHIINDSDEQIKKSNRSRVVSFDKYTGAPLYLLRNIPRNANHLLKKIRYLKSFQNRILKLCTRPVKGSR